MDESQGEQSPWAARLETVGKGAVMGLADVVPGVSGGTMALLLGIYNRFIAALANLDGILLKRASRVFSADGRRLLLEHARQIDFWFLVQLGIGIGIAILAGAHAIEGLLVERPVEMMALFFGLILASVRLPWGQIAAPRAVHLVPAALGAALAALISLIPAATDSPPPGFLILGGAIAITAMLLPGISGSAILVLLGLYPVVLAAVSEFNVVYIALFALGAGLGLIFSSRGIKWLLANHGAVTMATLSGLMFGSLVRVWPWRDAAEFGAGAPAAPEWQVLVVAYLLAGAFISVGLEWLAKRGSRN